MCVSYAHFNFFPYKFQLNENAKALCFYCTDSKGKNICVKAIQWDKLWYDFPVFIVSHYGEQAVSFETVDLPESLPVCAESVYYATHPNNHIYVIDLVCLSRARTLRNVI